MEGGLRIYLHLMGESGTVVSESWRVGSPEAGGGHLHRLRGTQLSSYDVSGRRVRAFCAHRRGSPPTVGCRRGAGLCFRGRCCINLIGRLTVSVHKCLTSVTMTTCVPLVVSMAYIKRFIFGPKSHKHNLFLSPTPMYMCSKLRTADTTRTPQIHRDTQERPSRRVAPQTYSSRAPTPP